jgi:hypothetical protein
MDLYSLAEQMVCVKEGIADKEEVIMAARELSQWAEEERDVVFPRWKDVLKRINGWNAGMWLYWRMCYMEDYPHWRASMMWLQGYVSL